MAPCGLGAWERPPKKRGEVTPGERLGADVVGGDAVGGGIEVDPGQAEEGRDEIDVAGG